MGMGVMVGWLWCTKGKIEDDIVGSVYQTRSLLWLIRKALSGGQWNCFDDYWYARQPAQRALRASLVSSCTIRCACGNSHV